MFESPPALSPIPGLTPSPVEPPVRGRPWLDELNPEQLMAATHAGGPLLVLAGAGTGKTTTLVARVAWLMASGVPAERILLLTFTRRAAREMVERARSLVARVAPDAGRLAGGTFHSVAHRLVRRHAAVLGLAPGFGVLDAGDAADLLDLVRQEHGMAATARRFPRRQTVLDIYSRTVNAQAQLSDVLAEQFPWCAEHRDALVELFRAYGERKRALGVIDLDDLLLLWRALAADEVIGPRLAADFDHVLVDEYQDVNGLQVEIVRSLAAGGPQITAVGDDFQAIYSFRAASARHILDFPSHFPDATVVTLERNYRSTMPILAVANAVSAQDRHGFPKRLRAQAEGGQRPELVFPRDESDQAVAVADRVLAAREEGMDLRAQAVLFRAGHDSALLELELSRRAIPFVKYGGLRYLEAAHVKDYVALMRLTDNPADEMSWFRVLQVLDGVGPVRARAVLERLQAQAGAPADLTRWAQARAQVPEGAREHADAIVAALAEDRAEHGAGVRAERLRDALAPALRVRYPDAAVRLADLDQLAAAAAEASDLRHFVSDLVIDPPASTSDLAGPPHLDEDFLVLSTVHSAKGLEWQAVHVIAAYDGNFPADMAAGSAEGIAEERRLLYVALTRPRRRLHVYVPLRYHHRPHGRDDAHGYGRPSRFLTGEVQALLSQTRTEGARLGEASGPPVPAAGRRIEISLDGLLR
jgi:DNA helicase-2/ATP-dependent DNA helicase PcrA